MKRTDYNTNSEYLIKSENTGYKETDTSYLLVNTVTGEVLYEIKKSDCTSCHCREERDLIIITKLIGDVARVTIYDPVKEKFVCKDYFFVENNLQFSEDTILLLDPKTYLYHVLPLKSYYQRPEITDKGFKEMEILSQKLWETYHVFTNENDKKQVYFNKRNELDETEFEDIRAEGIVYVIKEGDKEYFAEAFMDYGGKLTLNNKSELYDHIWVDINSNAFYYAIKGDQIDVYIVTTMEGLKKAFTVTGQDINCFDKGVVGTTDECTQRFYFDITNNGKHGIGVFDLGKNQKYEEFIPAQYDAILKLNNIYELRDGDSITVVLSQFYNPVIISEDYVSYNILADSGTFVFSTENYDDIIDPVNGKKVLNKCKLLHSQNFNILFEKDGKEGVLWGINNPKVTDGYDKVEPLYYNYYRVTKNGKQGLLYKGKEIIPPIHKALRTHSFIDERERNNVNAYPRRLMIEIETDDNRTYIYKFNTNDDSLLPFNINELGYATYEFYDKMIVLKNGDTTAFYNHSGKCIATFEGNKLITQVKLDNNGIKESVYLVDGKCYRVDNLGAFELNVKTIYRTIIESEYGSLFIEDIDEESFEDKIAAIEALGEEYVNQAFIGMYKSRPDIQNKYPQLLLK